MPPPTTAVIVVPAVRDTGNCGSFIARMNRRVTVFTAPTEDAADKGDVMMSLNAREEFACRYAQIHIFLTRKHGASTHTPAHHREMA